MRLRAVEPEDWEAFLAFEEDSVAVRNGDSLHPPRSAAAARKWATELAEREPDLDHVRLVIASTTPDASTGRDTSARTDASVGSDTSAGAGTGGGRPVGMINTHDVDRVHGTFRYGIAIGTSHHRKGYASEAVVLLLRYMFFERRFQKAEACVYSSNEPSLALHQRLGFVEEGRRRRSRYAAGRFDDEFLFGMTIEEFAALYG